MLPGARRRRTKMTSDMPKQRQHGDAEPLRDVGPHTRPPGVGLRGWHPGPLLVEPHVLEAEKL